MEDLFYLYSLVCVAYILINFVKLIQNKGEKEPVNTEDFDLTNPNESIYKLKKTISPDFVVFILNSIWIFLGFFTEERNLFFILSGTSILLMFLAINKGKKESSIIFIVAGTLKLLIILVIMYVHFYKNNIS